MNFRATETQGTLYVISTPIGNLGDLSPRAVECLRNVALVCAEDTRTFAILAKKFSLDVSCVSYHDFNERSRTTQIISRLREGDNIALVSEAGTPTISDPGYRLVHQCRLSGITVTAVPGACALIAALSISGLPTDRFYFGGFLPQKKGKRRRVLEEACASGVTSIFYESPYRVLKTLEELETLAPERSLFLARELTKKFEETLSGTAREILSSLKQRASIKGELTLIVSGADD